MPELFDIFSFIMLSHRPPQTMPVIIRPILYPESIHRFRSASDRFLGGICHVRQDPGIALFLFDVHPYGSPFGIKLPTHA